MIPIRLTSQIVALFVLSAIAPLFADEPVATTRPLIDGTTLVYAAKEQAAEFLGEEDEYTQSLSGIDRRIRMQATEDPGDEAFRRHAAEAARDWSEEERAKVNAAWDQVAGPLKDLRAKLPEEILMIRTSGAEESNAAYTRRNAIILPEKALERDTPKLARLLAHELFHALSRAQPTVRWDLYRIIGFEPCELTDVPESLTSRKITNPDAPLWNTRIQIGKPGEQVDAVPILLAGERDGKVQTTGSLFEIMEFKLLLVEKSGDAWNPMRADERPLLVNPRSVPTFAEKIGRNTPYIIHPDEILAENFVHAIFDAPDLPDPEIVEQLDQILFRP